MGVFSVPPGRGVRGGRFNHFRFGRLVDEFLNATPQDEPHRIGVMEAPRPHEAFMVCLNEACKGEGPWFTDEGDREWFVYGGASLDAYDCPVCGEPGTQYVY